MEAEQHDAYYWKVIHHLIVNRGYRLLQQQENEAWLEDEESKPRRILRIVRADVDWANWLKRDIVASVSRFELLRRQLRLNELIGENLYISVYPPVDSWEELQKPFVANKQKKTTVYTSLVTREAAAGGEVAVRELVLPAATAMNSVEEIELTVKQLRQEVVERAQSREREERQLFLFGKPRMIYVLLALIAVMYWLVEQNGGSTSVLTLIEFGAKYNPLIIQGEWWRLVSAMFLHIGFLHLFMNSLALFYLGGAVERMYGTGRFLVIYFIAGVFGSAASFAFNEQVAAGASGAIFGCFGALLYFGTIHKKLFFRTMGKSVLFVLGLNLIFGLTVPMIDNGAHVGGLIGGFFASAIVHLPKHAKSARQLGAFVLTVISIGGLLWYGMINEQKAPSALLSLQIGQEYLQQEELEKAYPFLQQAVENGADMPEAPFLLAYAEAMFGNYEEAKQLLLEVIQQRADFHQAHYNLALIYLELGETEEARASVERAIQLEPNEPMYEDLYEQITDPPT
ncbi:rhomboid family intramembrane serine protease [Alkalihalobacillus oceani]|uniref:Rhomboid family intramembrane serine protease n=1 Tax=Halalkalibacter oceani TaxID=1653776 RepID=A0A9X2IMZ3_9BACI|nr:rhomboid family intramembrane serine protease [Halalkalibacter oceani]